MVPFLLAPEAPHVVLEVAKLGFILFCNDRLYRWLLSVCILNFVNEVAGLRATGALNTSNLVDVYSIGDGAALESIITPNHMQTLFSVVEVLDQFFNQPQFLLLSQFYLFYHCRPAYKYIIIHPTPPTKVYSYPHTHTIIS